MVTDADTLGEKALRLVAWVVVSLILATISWHFVEKPMLNSVARPHVRTGHRLR